MRHLQENGAVPASKQTSIGLISRMREVRVLVIVQERPFTEHKEADEGQKGKLNKE